MKIRPRTLPVSGGLSRHRLSRSCLLATGVLAFLGHFSALPAQETNDNPATGEVMKLPPFVVDTRKDTGYAAQNTMSGTRLNSPLGDLGVTMTIFTPEVWNDLALSSTNDLINYTPGAQVNYNNTFFFGDAVKFRGILVENILRNSYKTNIPNDSYNAERMEFHRGPNAILVNGSSTTGGVNRTTSKAEFSGANRLLFRADAYGTTRTEVDLHHTVLDDKLAVRFITLQENAQTWRNPIGYKEQQRYYGAIKWRPVQKVTAHGRPVMSS